MQRCNNNSCLNKTNLKAVKDIQNININNGTVNNGTVKNDNCCKIQ